MSCIKYFVCRQRLSNYISVLFQWKTLNKSCCWTDAIFVLVLSRGGQRWFIKYLAPMSICHYRHVRQSVGGVFVVIAAVIFVLLFAVLVKSGRRCPNSALRKIFCSTSPPCGQNGRKGLVVFASPLNYTKRTVRFKLVQLYIYIYIWLHWCCWWW